MAADLAIDAGQLRRNIVTAGVELQMLIGRSFAIGDAVLRGVRPCDPCKHLEGLTRPGLTAELASHGGGLRAGI